MRGLLGDNDVLAYLVMMTARLVELRRALKSTGSLYLHCDPTASHYLKVMLDTVFGPTNFLNEITWRRTYTHGNVGKNYGSVSDILLFYAKGPPRSRSRRRSPRCANHDDTTPVGVVGRLPHRRRRDRRAGRDDVGLEATVLPRAT
jgi:hypothetical protein